MRFSVILYLWMLVTSSWDGHGSLIEVLCMMAD